MPCNPFAPMPDPFFGQVNFQTGINGQWAFQAFQRSADILVVELKRSSTIMDSVVVPSGSSTNWRWFSTNNFVALRAVTGSTNPWTFRLWIFDLRNSAAVTHYEVVLLSSSGTNLVVDHSPDGLAFFVYVWESPESSSGHGVYWSDNGILLCSSLPSATYPAAQRVAEIAVGKIWIYASPGPALPAPYPGSGGGYLIASCDLPSGKCSVSEANFPDVVWDGSGPKTQSLPVPIKNIGSDCLQINGITGVVPFTVSSPPMFPVFVGPSEQIDFTLKFAPAGLGNFDKFLTIALGPSADPASDTQIHCTGKARESLADCEVTDSSQVLQVVFGVSVNNSARGTYGIKNKGDDLLKVESISDSTHFAVAVPPDFNRFLGHDEKLSVIIEFIPTAITAPSIAEDLQVICIPPNGASKINCKGSARLPNLGLNAVQPAPFTTYLFRRKRIEINLTNSGEVPLTIDVTSSATLFNFLPIGPIPANTSQLLVVYVWSDHLGNFSVPLTICGTYHLIVNDKNGQNVIDNNLQTYSTVVVSGTAIPMPPDMLESNNDFATATRVDLPGPPFLKSVQLGYADLSLDDQNGGQDKDYFAVSYKSSPQDDNCTTGGISQLRAYL